MNIGCLNAPIKSRGVLFLFFSAVCARDAWGACVSLRILYLQCAGCLHKFEHVACALREASGRETLFEIVRPQAIQIVFMNLLYNLFVSESLNESLPAQTAVRAMPWLAVTVAALGYFVDLYDLVIFSVVRVASLGPGGLGLLPADPSTSITGWERIAHLFQVTFGFATGDITSAGVAIFNAQLVGMVLGGFAWGMLGDRRGRLTTLFGSIALYSTANLLTGFVDSVPMYAALRFVAGFGLAGELGAGVTLVSELLGKKHRGWGTMIIAFAGMFGPIVASVVGANFAWRHAYIIGSVMGFALLALRLGVAESGIYSRTALRNKKRGDPRMLFFPWNRLKRFACVVLLGTPIWFVGGIIFVFAPELARGLGLSEPVRPPTVIMCGYAGAAIGDLISSALSQWLQSRRAAVSIFIIVLAIAIAGLLIFGGRSAFAFYAWTFAAGIATGYWAVFVTIAGESFGTNLRATAATTAPNLVRGAAVIMVTAWELLTPGAGMIGAAAVVACVVVALGLIAVWRLPEPFAHDLDFEEV
ncbi:MAG: MFS transporter [Phycisphaerales bacterium]|nr:MFS transporter [Phycisphaerales bacterium]